MRKLCALFSVAAAALVWLVLALASAACGDDNATTPPATLTPATPAATVPAASTIPAVHTFPVVVPALSPGFVPPAKRPCPNGWARISDDKANYSFCLPPGWGMVDHETGQARADALIHWESAAILSPEAFPYPYAGSYAKGVRDLIRDSEKNIIWMQIFFLQTDGSDQPMSCDAKPSGTLGGLPSVSCENHFNIPSGTDQALPDPQGEWGRLFVAVPLPNAGIPPSWESSPYPTPKGGYSFAVGILFEGRNEALSYHRDVISQILNTLEGQP